MIISPGVFRFKRGGAPVPITSMFSVAECDFGFFGYHDSTTNPAQMRWQGGSGGIYTWTGYVTGTDARMISLLNGQAGYVSVDDGAEVLATATAGYIELFAALSDTAHLVRVRGYYWTNVSGDCIEVTGAVPAIGQGTDLGTAYNINDPDETIVLSSHSVGALPAANITPQIRFTTYDSPVIYARQGTIVINAQCDCIWIFGGMPNCWLSIDRARPVKLAYSATASNNYAWHKIASGLDNTQAHEYWIIPERNTVGAVPLGVMIGDSGATYSALDTSIKHVLAVGDSITAAWEASTVPRAAVDVHEYCIANGWLPYCYGYAGKTTSELDTDFASIIANLVRTPDYLINQIGHNDVTGAQFVTDYTALLTTELAAGFTKIACRIIVPNNTLTANDLAQNEDMLTAIAAVGSPAGVGRVGDSATWLHVSTIEGNGGVDGDNPDALGLHPDVSGYHTLAGYQASAMATFFV